MADTLQRTSPLQVWAERFAQLPDAVAIVEEPFVTMVELRVDPSGPGSAAVAQLLGVELPTTASTYANNFDTTVIWLGPDEWLVTGTSLAGPDLEVRLRETVSPHGGAAVDVSGQRTTLRLRGSHSRDVLAKGCALDLHPRVFTGGAAAQTTLGQAGVILLSVDGGGADYRVLVRSSFARYLAGWLLDAAEEYNPERTL
ncbi:MAG: sarcosine oxidase subunit gamma family protein [Mycobacterium sp.]